MKKGLAIDIEEQERFIACLKFVQTCEQGIPKGVEHLMRKYRQLKEKKDIPHSKVTTAFKEMIAKGIPEAYIIQIIEQAKFDMMVSIFSAIEDSSKENKDWTMYFLSLDGESEYEVQPDEISSMMIGYFMCRDEVLATQMKIASVFKQ